MRSKRIIFSAPGSGMGHVVRASALALGLRDAGMESVIVASSTFAAGLAQLTRIETVSIPLRQWAEQVRDCVASLTPDLVVVDSFPFGLRGEWLHKSRFRFLHLARRLKVEPYLNAIDAPWQTDSPTLAYIVLLEELTSDHRRLLPNVHALSGPVRFPLEAVDVPQPELPKKFQLVVHAGPDAELERLLDAVDPARGEVVAISPKPSTRPHVTWIEYFPAARLFPQANWITTGAGYNSMAEAAPFRHKHTAIPFERRYDDQAARATTATPAQSGTHAAVRILMDAVSC